MSWPDVTRGLLILGAVLVVIYDGLAFWQAGSEATVSRVALRWAVDYPLVPFALGVLVGHLFAAQPR